MDISIFWFRRDLRIEDNHAFYMAQMSGLDVLPIFIFDTEILNDLDKTDSRVSFIHKKLSEIDLKFKQQNSSILCLYGNILEKWQEIIGQYQVKKVFFNKDYEPYARKRDEKVTKFLSSQGIDVFSYKDQVIFEESDVLKKDGTPYTVFTPYKNKWLEHLKNHEIKQFPSEKLQHLFKIEFPCPSLTSLGFLPGLHKVRPFRPEVIDSYAETRNFPSFEGTNLGPHLRFGTLSIRQIITNLKAQNSVFFDELIWREFFMQILFHFPQTENENFKPQYNRLQWRNSEKEFEKWCRGETGYLIVDAGMRELNSTGYMHNRVRMVAASFLCKHLLIDWRWGEAWFAEKLLDFELSSNVGNWQWAASTGCDAAPYFRIFNPEEQHKKFDPKSEYIKRFCSESEILLGKQKIVEHNFARNRALTEYKKALYEP